MMSRAASAQWELLAAPHTRFPWRLFLLLRDPGLSTELADREKFPDCVIGVWAANLRKLYPSLSGIEFMAILAEQASNLATDTSLLEAKHASIRRLLLSASMQTHALAHPQLSARWVLTQCRRRGRKRTATKVIRKRPAHNGKKGRRKRGTGFMTKKGHLKKTPRGGVQRAFVRLASMDTRGLADIIEVGRRF